MAGSGNKGSGKTAAPSLADLFAAMWSWTSLNWRIAAGAVASAVFLALLITLLIPRDYEATMVVTAVESSSIDPSTLMATPGISIRAPLSLNEGPPPQMAAFVKLLKSPEVARKLTQDPRAMQAIRNASRNWLDMVSDFLTGNGKPDEAAQIHRVLNWLTYHVTVDQDVDVRTWTIDLRDPDADDAVYLLSKVHASAEQILRSAAITQFQKEKEFGISFLNTTTDAQEKEIIYGILGSIDRSLLVLRSGANVATVVISSPYAPDRPSYPPRIMILLVALGSLIFLLFAALFAHCYLRLVRGHRDSNPRLAAAAADA